MNTTRDDEAFIHFEECLNDLNSALRILEALQQAQIPPVLWAAAYHMALIEYAKPFKMSWGVNKRKHVLPTPLLPESGQQLHIQLLDLRDQVLAHSDLSVKDARVYVSEISGQPVPIIVSNAEPVLPSIIAVKTHVEHMLDALYAQRPTYEQQYKDTL